MKNSIGLVLIIFVACNAPKNAHNSNLSSTALKNSHKDSTLNSSGFDTLNYLREDIVAKKEKYLNRQVSELLNDLKFPVKSYLYGIGYVVGTVTDITIAFENNDSVHFRLINHSIPPLLVITFNKTLPLDSVAYFRAKGHGQWLQDEKRYYGNKIIADLTYVK